MERVFIIFSTLFSLSVFAGQFEVHFPYVPTGAVKLRAVNRQADWTQAERLPGSSVSGFKTLHPVDGKPLELELTIDEDSQTRILRRTFHPEEGKKVDFFLPGEGYSVCSLTGIAFGAKVFLDGKRRTDFESFIRDGRLEVRSRFLSNQSMSCRLQFESSAGFQEVNAIVPPGERRYVEVTSTALPPSALREVPAQTVPAQVAEVRVRVTLDAFIYIGKIKTEEEGEIRTFRSPPIPPGGTYTMDFKFDYRDGASGRRVIRTKKFVLKPGERVNVENIEVFAESVDD